MRASVRQRLEATASYVLPTERWGKFTFSGGYTTSLRGRAARVAPSSVFSEIRHFTPPLAPERFPGKGISRGEVGVWRGFDFIATGNTSVTSGTTRSKRRPRQVGGPLTSPILENPDGPGYIHARHAVELEFVKPDAESNVCEGQQECDAAGAAAAPSIWQRLLWGTS